MFGILVQVWRLLKHLEHPYAVQSPINTLLGCTCLVVGYIMFVRHGPRLMENRRPLELRVPMLAYNALQIAINISIVMTGWRYIKVTNVFCTPISYEDTESVRHLASLVYLFYLIKIVDVLDTVFIVLRKRDYQLSYLHTVHHAGMMIVGFVGAKYMPGGQCLYVGLVNCPVHAIMYGYYLYALYFRQRYSVGWKRHITHLQMAQFTFFIVSYGSATINTECTFPKLAAMWFTFGNGLMLAMFGQFYYYAYLHKAPRPTGAAVPTDASQQRTADAQTTKAD